MNVTFAYDPKRELTPYRRGLHNTFNPNQSPFSLEVQAAGIGESSAEEIAAFALATIEREHIDVASFVASFSASWKAVEQGAAERFRRIFQTDWDPGEVTGYLTLNTSCPYNIHGPYYYISITRKALWPVGGTLHELLHFYTHALIEPLFVDAGIPEKHGDFKEALTVLLNLEFADYIECEDKGYPQHTELRADIARQWKAGQDIYAITKQYISTQV